MSDLEMNVSNDMEKNEEVTPANEVTPVQEETVAEVVVPVQEETAAEVVTPEPEVKEVVAEKVKPAPVKKVRSSVPEEFDWNSIGKKQILYSKDEQNKLEQLYDKTLSSIVEQEVIDGQVVAMNTREIVVNIGFKSDGVIPLSELRYNPELKVGDHIEVYVESQEDRTGQLVLSHKKARTLRSWERMLNAAPKEVLLLTFLELKHSYLAHKST
jgi:small subunit ribosomal protein S1